VGTGYFLDDAGSVSDAANRPDGPESQQLATSAIITSCAALAIGASTDSPGADRSAAYGSYRCSTPLTAS
jgi:hypothetical protein